MTAPETPTSSTSSGSGSKTSGDHVVQPVVQPVGIASEPMAIPYGMKLNGAANYSLWSQIAETFVVGRCKLGYLTGSTQEPSCVNAAYEKWSMENAIVKGWLIGAVEPDGMNLFIRLPTAKDIWDAVSQTYYEGGDHSVIYDISRRAMKKTQEGKYVSAYYAD